MKYSQCRIALLTFVFGVISVSFFNAEYEIWTEIPVDVPQVMSDTPIILHLETEGHQFNMGGGSSGCGREEPTESLLGSKATYPRKKNKKSLLR